MITAIYEVNVNKSYYIDNMVKRTIPSEKEQLIKVINNYVKVATELVSESLDLERK